MAGTFLGPLVCGAIRAARQGQAAYEATPTPGQARELRATMERMVAKGTALRLGQKVDGEGMSAAVYAIRVPPAVVSLGEQGPWRLARAELLRGA